MKRILVCLALLLFSACGMLPTGGGDTRLVEMERPFTLGEGNRAVARGTRVVVEFVGVPLDERCPIEAFCVSPGNAVVRVRISQPGAAAQTFDLQTMDASPRAVQGDYGVELLDLQPQASVHVEDPDYRVRLRIDPVFHID